MSGHDEHAALVQHLVRFGRGRAVGAFDDQLGLDVADVLGGDLFLERGGDEDVDVELEERPCWPSGSPPGKPATVLCCATWAISFGMSRPLALWTPPFQSVTPMIFAPCARHQLGADRADVAEALDRDARALELEAECFAAFARARSSRRGRWPRGGRASRPSPPACR